MQEKIDFVVTWVDGNDPVWQKEKNKYLGTDASEDNVGAQRYRDWDLMKYWFRGVEKFAPWVHKVYFVTCGQKPEWLNESYEKLVCVNHSDYMPLECIPTFNSSAIEVGLHKIKGLSEKFVQFNDDFFLINSIKPEDFFVNELPCDFAALDALTPNNEFEYLRMNNMLIINRHFSMKEVVKTHKDKWINFKDPKSLYRTVRLLSPWVSFSGIRDYHIPIAFTKTDFEMVWDSLPGVMENTQKHRFRSREDNTAWLVRYWRLAEGRFYPKSRNAFGYMSIDNDDVAEISNAIKKQKKRILCLNDDYKGTDFEGTKKNLIASFEEILPEKCGFEI